MPAETMVAVCSTPDCSPVMRAPCVSFPCASKVVSLTVSPSAVVRVTRALARREVAHLMVTASNSGFFPGLTIFTGRRLGPVRVLKLPGVEGLQALDLPSRETDLVWYSYSVSGSSEEIGKKCFFWRAIRTGRVSWTRSSESVMFRSLATRWTNRAMVRADS